MITSLIVCGVSILCAVLIGAFLHHEAQQGVRHAPRLRVWLDSVVVTGERLFSRVIGSWARQMLRQVFHYLFHTVLVTVSRMLSHGERVVRELIRTNRAVARKSEREQYRSSTLDEVMHHKIAVSLTEEEKKVHKERSLRG
jgi:hypothetical protein